MAFGFIGKAVNGIGDVASAAYSLVKKVPKPILKEAYDLAVSAVAKKVIHKVALYVPIIKKLVKRDDSMNPLEKFIRDVVAFGKNMADGVQVSDAAALVDLVTSTSEVYSQFNAASLEERKEMLAQALDALLGEEETAIIGPNGLYKLDIPVVNDEMAFDVMIQGAVALLGDKLAPPPVNSP